MSLPKEPRQLMINLMYLVLTAMLALNVSSEILQAFKTINNSITRSNQSIQGKNNELYVNFEANTQLAESRDRVTPFNERAKEVKAEADKMVAELEEWKKKVIAASGGYTPENEIKAESDIDASTRILVEEKGGDQIKAKLLALREFMISKVAPEKQAAYQKDLPLRIDAVDKSDTNPGADWKVANFYNMPVMGAVTLFTKMQNDIRTSESAIIEELFKESSAKTLKFDEIIALGVSKTSYALQGQKVEGTIMLAAYNKSVTPRVSVSSGRVTAVKDGIASWESTAAGVGLQTVRGTLTIDNNGQTLTKPFDFTYMVGSAGAAFQLDAMNVVYAGIPNPASISAAGYSMEDVSLSVPGAEVKMTSKGHYELIVPVTAKDLSASINVRTAAGNKTVSSFPIRVKRIPDPAAEVGGKSQGLMPASTFRAQLGIVSELKDFLFPIRSQVSSFSFSMSRRGSTDIFGPFTVRGARFGDNKEVENLVKGAKPGDKIFIEEIRATVPDGGAARRTNPVILTLN
jgi:gliding motility-associated protein GldM